MGIRNLTIVGGVRDAPFVWRRGRLGTVCARVAWPAWSCGPSTSPLDASGHSVVDDIARRRLAELARHLAAGRITNDDFEEQRPASSERALYEVYFYGLWPLYDDFITHRLTGRWALTPDGRAWVARIVLFLRSGQSYRYPNVTGLLALPFMLLSMVTLGWFGRFWVRYRWRDGDESVWPFYSREDYERALAHPVYLNGRAGV